MIYIRPVIRPWTPGWSRGRRVIVWGSDGGLDSVELLLQLFKLTASCQYKPSISVPERTCLLLVMRL